MLILGGHVVSIDQGRQQTHALKAAIGALAPTVLLLLDFGLRPALPAQDEPVLAELEVDVVFGEAGEFRLQDESVFGLIDVEGRHPGRLPPGPLVPVARPARGLGPAVHRFTHAHHVRHRIPLCDCHESPLLS